MVKIEKIEHADMVLNSNNSFKDKLSIYVYRNKVMFEVEVDGTGNTFTCSKEEMKKALL